MDQRMIFPPDAPQAPLCVESKRLKSLMKTSKKGPAISRGALMLGGYLLTSVIMGTAPGDSGTRPDTV